MEVAKYRLVAAGVWMALGLGACIGESPIVGTEGGGTGGSAGIAGGGATGATGGGTATSTNYKIDFLVDTPDDMPLCLPYELAVDDAGRANCNVFAVPMLPTGGECACDSPGRYPVADGDRATVIDKLRFHNYCADGGGAAPDCSELCVCGVDPAGGDDWYACVGSTNADSDVNGWCYVSPAQGVGNDALVESCPFAPRARMRVLGDARPRAEHFALACHGVTELPEEHPGPRKALGEGCLPADEQLLAFSSYAIGEVSVITDTSECDSNVCLVNHFQGRVSCPYGQTESEVGNDPQCFAPGTNLAVTVPVEPQLVQRRAEDAAICSCRCDGPGPGELCACPGGMECVPLIDEKLRTVASLHAPKNDRC